MVITQINAPSTAQIRTEIIKVYSDAWADTRYAPTKHQLRDFSAVLDLHLSRDDFRLVEAREEEGTELLGFAYGYTSVKGGWWREIVVDAIGPELAAQWFNDGFEFVELAVAKDARRRGIGGALHDALMEGAVTDTAVLSTQSGNQEARALYTSKGWTTIRSNFHFPNRPYPYELLGRDLRRPPSR